MRQREKNRLSFMFYFFKPTSCLNLSASKKEIMPHDIFAIMKSHNFLFQSEGKLILSPKSLPMYGEKQNMGWVPTSFLMQKCFITLTVFFSPSPTRVY